MLFLALLLHLAQFGHVLVLFTLLSALIIAAKGLHQLGASIDASEARYTYQALLYTASGPCYSPCIAHRTGLAFEHLQATQTCTHPSQQPRMLTRVAGDTATSIYLHRMRLVLLW